LIHFDGWNKRWNAWFDVGKILEFNKRNIQKNEKI